jgi:hypothetical protein
MRLPLVLCLSVLAGPALADSRVKVVAETPEAAADAATLIAALQAGLAGPHAGCPVLLDETGDIPVTVAHEAGPPEGWSVRMGPADAPTFSATGAGQDTAAAGILDLLCPKQGNAATIGPWKASGGGAQIKVTGQVADLMAVFTLEGEFPGGTATFEYTPVSPGGGAVSYSLSGSGVTGAGDGVYSLKALENGVYSLEQTTNGCIDGIANSCRTNSETITLTPVGQ